MQSIESECNGYTGFTDGFLCFELLENSHYPDIKESHTLILNELNFFRRLTDEYIFSESIVRYGLNGLLDRIEMVQIGKEEEEYEKYNQDINPRCIDEDFNSLVELFEVYLKDKNYYIRLHTNEERIRGHLDLCLSAWREGVFFNNKMTSRNILTSDKQENIILEKLISIEENGYDMKNYILNFRELLEGYHIDSWIDNKERDEPELPLNPFLSLWSLQEKGYLKIHFGSTNLMVLDDPIYRIEMIKTDNKKSKIDSFLEKIQALKELSQAGVLETRKEQDLLTEMRNFQYDAIIDDEVILLKIKKLQAHPQTIWSTPRNGGYSGTVNQYILEWELLFRGYIGKSETLSQKSENKSKILESSNNENANEIKVSFDFNDKKLLHITPYIVYDKTLQEFTNPKNLKKYKLTQIYSRHLINLLAKKNNYPVIEFIEKNPSLISEYKKGKKGGKKWSSMHEFLQSKTKNIREKLELHLAISKEESTSFFTCSKDLIAINTID